MLLFKIRFIITTVTLKINERFKKGQAFFESLNQFIKSDTSIKVVKIPNTETLKAIKDVELGKTIKEKNSQQLFKELGI